MAKQTMFLEEVDVFWQREQRTSVEDRDESSEPELWPEPSSDCGGMD